MLLPGRPAVARPAHAGLFQERAMANVNPQLKVCTPCIRVGGRWCFSLPVIGRKCLNVPSLGTWKACCKTIWRPPFVKCGLSRC